MQLTDARQIKGEDGTEDDVPSTSGRHFSEADTSYSVPKVVMLPSIFDIIKLVR